MFDVIPINFLVCVRVFPSDKCQCVTVLEKLS